MTTDTDTTTPIDPNEEVLNGYDDYWGVDIQEKHFLPDGKQYFVLSVMNEGQRAKYQREMNQDLQVNRAGDARIKVDQAKERHTLLKTVIVDWFMVRDGKSVPFDRNSVLNWLDKANPKIVDDVEFAIRLLNPWLQTDMSVEDIDKEIERLKTLREQAEEREQGKASSKTK